MGVNTSRSTTISFLISVTGHILLLYIVLLKTGPGFRDFVQPTVYSVTLEAGKKKGGITQVPDSKKETAVAPPKKVKAPEPETKPDTPKEKPHKEEKAPEEPPEDAEVSLAEKEEKKPTPKPTPQSTPKPKPTAKPKPKATPKPKPKSKSTPKSKPKPKPKPKEPSLAEINKRLQAAVQRYKGESTDAGGEGFGSTGRGRGRAMGGGQVRSPEFLRYMKTLEYSVKSGWRWHDSRAALQARVCFRISPTGQLSDVRLCSGSGNDRYDDSVVRAVQKANPVPPPPQSVYEYFRDVSVTFSPTS